MEKQRIIKSKVVAIMFVTRFLVAVLVYKTVERPWLCLDEADLPVEFVDGFIQVDHNANHIDWLLFIMIYSSAFLIKSS